MTTPSEIQKQYTPAEVLKKYTLAEALQRHEHPAFRAALRAEAGVKLEIPKQQRPGANRVTISQPRASRGKEHR